MGLALTGTRYVLNTDDLLSGADERSWIEVADDPKSPTTRAKSFQELDDEAIAGGVGSDAEKARDAVIATLSAIVRQSEGWVESYGQNLYIIPFTPVDAYVLNLIVDYAFFRGKVRKGMFRNTEERVLEEKTYNNRAGQIRSLFVFLSSTRIDEGRTDLLFDWGSDTRRTHLE